MKLKAWALAAAVVSMGGYAVAQQQPMGTIDYCINTGNTASPCSASSPNLAVTVKSANSSSQVLVNARNGRRSVNISVDSSTPFAFVGPTPLTTANGFFVPATPNVLTLATQATIYVIASAPTITVRAIELY